MRGLVEKTNDAWIRPSIFFLWTAGRMRSNVKIMKAKNLLYLALFVTFTALTSGCQKTDANLESENADLKTRVQQLEKQLEAANGQAASAQSQSTAAGDLQAQLAEAQKKADTATDAVKSLSGQVDTLRQKIDALTRQLTDTQQARQKAEQALQLYQDKAGAALRQFQTLRNTLGGQTPNLKGYHQNYLATQSAVNNSLTVLPESQVRRQIAAVLAQFTQLDNTWQTADRQMQARTQEAKADYDKLMDFGGLGPNRYTVEMGKDKILTPLAQANATTALHRDQQMVAQEKNLDQGIQNLQALLNG